MNAGRGANWWKIGALGIVFFVVAYGLVALESRQKSRESHEPRTTYSAAAGGYKALYLWLQNMNIPVRRWEKKLSQIPAAASVLLMVEPEFAPSAGELKELDNWVTSGGTFVVIVGRPNIFLQKTNLRLQPPFATKHCQGKRNERTPLLYQPGPYTREIRRLHSTGHPSLGSCLPEGIVHLRSRWGGLLMVLNKGKGRVIGLADPNLLCNVSLRDADHSRLAINILLTHLGSGILLIDEYHHGYGRAATVVEHLFSSEALIPLLQTVLLLLVLWAARGRRFGIPRVLIQEKRRSSLEYVSAMAHLYQRGRGQVSALDTLVRWIEEQAKSMLVHKDNNLRNALLTARRQLEKKETTEKELLTVSRGLYLALEEARRKAVGISRQ
jgi:hypothetical protein